jgi:hypothetical protein
MLEIENLTPAFNSVSTVKDDTQVVDCHNTNIKTTHKNLVRRVIKHNGKKKAPPL